MHEARALALELASSSAGAMLRLSAFQAMWRAGRRAVPGAIGVEAIDDFRVWPIEEVDAERRLPVSERMRRWR